MSRTATASHLSRDVSRWTTGLTSMCPAAASSSLGFARVASATAGTARAPGLEDARPNDARVGGRADRAAAGRLQGATSSSADHRPERDRSCLSGRALRLERIYLDGIACAPAPALEGADTHRLPGGDKLEGNKGACACNDSHVARLNVQTNTCASREERVQRVAYKLGK